MDSSVNDEEKSLCNERMGSKKFVFNKSDYVVLTVLLMVLDYWVCMGFVDNTIGNYELWVVSVVIGYIFIFFSIDKVFFDSYNRIYKALTTKSAEFEQQDGNKNQC